MTLRPTDAVERGDWIRERLGAWSTIAGVMPRGFEAYARVFHPIDAQLIEWDARSRSPNSTGSRGYPRPRRCRSQE